MIELREFGKGDWDGFSGADKFSDGSNPLIGEIIFEDAFDELGGCIFVIVDRESIHVISDNYHDEEEPMPEWYYTGSSAEVIIRVASFDKEMTYENLIDMGFEKIN